MLFTYGAISGIWATVWAWTTPIVFVTLSAVAAAVIVLVVSSSTTTQVCCPTSVHRRSNDLLALVVPPPDGVAENVTTPCKAVLRTREEEEERREMMFPQAQQPAPCSDELRMLRMLIAVYVTLGEVLVGDAASLSPVGRMEAARSLVARTVATLTSWRAPKAIVSLLGPARDVTDLFTRRVKKNGSSGISKGRHAHYVALLLERSRTMEEVIAQSLWAGTMPVVPAALRTVAPIIPRAAKLGRIRRGNIMAPATRAGHLHVHHPRLTYVAGGSIMH